MTTETHPQVADAMKQMQQFQSTLEDLMQQINTGSFTGTDEDKTVEVTVNGQNVLTDLYIEDGLLRLGAETVAKRINEALRMAQASATAGLQAQQAQFYAGIVGITDSMKKGLGLT